MVMALVKTNVNASIAGIILRSFRMVILPNPIHAIVDEFSALAIGIEDQNEGKRQLRFLKDSLLFTRLGENAL